MQVEQHAKYKLLYGRIVDVPHQPRILRPLHSAPLELIALCIC